MTHDGRGKLSGERFRVVYRIRGDAAEALATARDVCVEQTVEFPRELIPAGEIRDAVVGQLDSFEPLDGKAWRATISYAAETVGSELTQLLNVAFGNSSLKPGVRVEWLDLPETLRRVFPGPRFGRAGLRAILGVPRRPLLGTAIKPLGLSPRQLAELTYQLALGGIDLIKDDHGLADQPFAPFAERVERCVEAVARANRETGRASIYLPNVTGAPEVMAQRARFAKVAGAGALLVAPGLAGLAAMAQLAADDAVALPILSHPAFQGSFVVTPDSGISHAALFGQIARLAGADASIYPHAGGRFSFSQEDCRAIAEACAAPLEPIKPIFPTPGGGMRLERVAELRAFYGDDVILLIGGGLHQHGPDLVESCRAFRRLVESG